MDAVQFLYFIVALLITLTVHEAAHALVAYYLGDPTAKIKGRLTLNPIAHLDAMGSLIFLATQRIGWGKPVPINPGNFKHPVRDSALTALAGPLSNFILAFFVALPWKYLGEYMYGTLLGEPILMILEMTFHVNIFLGVFNLFPFPPLDGSKILGLMIPKKFHRQYENYLANGMKYFVVIILVDVFILPDVLGYSVFHLVMGFLHEKIALILLLGT
jgi:Zn-dependent protease